MTSLTTRPMRRRRSRCRDRISVCREPDCGAGCACQGPGQEGCALRALDDLADALGCNRDEAIDLIDKASKIDADNDDIHPVNTTDNGAGAIAQAEKYAVYQLQYDRGDGNGEETISVYGISPDSRYWKDLNVGDGRVVFGGGLLDKFGWSEGQKVTLSDKYEGEHYSLSTRARTVPGAPSRT